MTKYPVCDPVTARVYLYAYLREYPSQHNVTESACLPLCRLRRTLASLFFAMSEDLQWTCISSPSRRQLLASLQASTQS